MAVRGIVASLLFSDEVGEREIDRMQNYFVNGRDVNGRGVERYNYFNASSIVSGRAKLTSEFSVVFGATAANKQLVERAIDEHQSIMLFFNRWSSTEGLENPSSFNLFAVDAAHAVGGSSNFTTVTMQCRTYGKTVNADFPGRKLPQQIFSPLMLRRS